MVVQDVEINLLKPSEYNPRSLSAKEKQDLLASLEGFGMVEPVVVNSNTQRKNIIIGGHQRYYVLKERGDITIPVVYIDIADIKKEQELNLRLNKNSGHWEWDLLANFDEQLLKQVGFNDDEMAILSGLKIDDLVASTEVDISRLDVIMVDGPNSPKLKNRKGFYFDTIEQFNEVVKLFQTDTEYKLDGVKLLELLKK